MTERAIRPLVAYYRVSTQRQGVSGLGLEAQHAAVRQYAAERGLELIAEFEEVESGRNPDRPKLREALALCQRVRACLCVAKLDRLARDAAFVLGLRAADVEFVACDLPFANRMVIGIMAIVAEYEAEQISQRTKAALAAAKARGVKLGGDRGAGTGKAREASIAKYRSRRERMKRTVEAAYMLEDGNLAATAKSLNEGDVPTPSGKGSWHPQTIARYVDRGLLPKKEKPQPRRPR